MKQKYFSPELEVTVLGYEDIMDGSPENPDNFEDKVEVEIDGGEGFFD